MRGAVKLQTQTQTQEQVQEQHDQCHRHHCHCHVDVHVAAARLLGPEVVWVDVTVVRSQSQTHQYKESLWSVPVDAACSIHCELDPLVLILLCLVHLHALCSHSAQYYSVQRQKGVMT